MKVCRVKPDDNTCCCCIDEQINTGIMKNCNDCWEDPFDYELLQLGVTFFGKPYAMVLRDGIIRKVPLSKVYDVREAKELCLENTEKN